jgi:hypothetical protein
LHATSKAAEISLCRPVSGDVSPLTISSETPMTRSLLLILLCSTLLGCQTTTRTVDAGMVLPETGERIDVGSTQRFIYPGEFSTLTLPEFPAAISERDRFDVTVCLSFTVNEYGETTDIKREDAADPACDSAAGRPSLIDAAAEAVESWEFLAAAICNYDTVEQQRSDDDSCNTARSVTAIPVRLAWAFRFKADGAERVVSTRRRQVTD